MVHIIETVLIRVAIDQAIGQSMPLSATLRRFSWPIIPSVFRGIFFAKETPTPVLEHTPQLPAAAKKHRRSKMSMQWSPRPVIRRKSSDRFRSEFGRTSPINFCGPKSKTKAGLSNWHVTDVQGNTWCFLYGTSPKFRRLNFHWTIVATPNKLRTRSPGARNERKISPRRRSSENSKLVGGFSPTPLKNMSSSVVSVGMMTFPTVSGKSFKIPWFQSPPTSK